MLTAEYVKNPVFKLFRDFVATKGLNMSHQRIMVLEAFLAAGPRTNVDELYIKLRNRYSTLGRSTVYRTLKLIAECGMARAIIVDGATTLHYEKLMNTYAAIEPEKCICQRDTEAQRKTSQNKTQEIQQ